MFKRFVHREVPLLCLREQSEESESVWDLAKLSDQLKAPEHPKLSLEEIKRLQCYWTNMKPTMRTKVISEMFGHLFREHPHMKTIWPFGRHSICALVNAATATTDGDVEVEEEMIQDNYLQNQQFRHHVNNVATALDILVNGLQRPVERVRSLIEGFGARHVYYGAIEPYFDLLEDAFIHALRANPDALPAENREQSVRDWRKAFKILKSGMQSGIVKERRTYMQGILSVIEAEQLRKSWQKLMEENGADALGRCWIEKSVNAYTALCDELIPQEQSHGELIDHALIEEKFPYLAADWIHVLDLVIMNIPHNVLRLPHIIHDYVLQYYMENVSPYVVREAIQKGLLEMLMEFGGPKEMNEIRRCLWNKVYRILVQTAEIVLVKR